MGHLHRVARAQRVRDDGRAASDAAGPGGARSPGSLFLGPFFFLTLRLRQLARGAARRACRRSCSTGSARSRSCRGRSCRTGRSMLLYALSLFVCATRRELDTHAQAPADRAGGRRRLLHRCSRCASRSSGPPPTACSASLFDVLAGFDQPFNQAPSLHIALVVILWALYARQAARRGAHLARRLVRADRRVGADHLPAPLHRHADRLRARAGCASGCGRCRRAARARCRVASHALTLRVAGLRVVYLAGARLRARASRCGAAAGRCGSLWPALSLALVAAELRGLGAARLPEDADGRLTRGALAARALSCRRVDQLALVDTARAAAGARRRRRVARPHAVGARPARRRSPAIVDLCGRVEPARATLAGSAVRARCSTS